MDVTLPGAILAAMVGAAFGLGSHTFYDAQGLSYLRDDPRACVNCHIMRDQYDGWQKSSHHASATCNDCHTPHDFVPKYLVKMKNGFRHSWAFTFQDFHEPIRIHEDNARVLQANCVRCHADLVAELSPRGGPHAEPLNCVHCHDSVGHGPTR